MKEAYQYLPSLERATKKNFNKIVTLRRELHQYPETAFCENRTAALVERELKRLDIPCKSGIAGTGLIADIEGGEGGKTLLLRADMDALQIEEQTGLPYASRTPGVMHACGHDAHTAWLLGVAHILKSCRSLFKGRVRLLFQPAEENGGGAKPMIAEDALNSVDAAVAAHVMPELPTGTVGIKKGIMTAFSDRFAITINGVGGHSSQPHKCINPITITAGLCENLQNIAVHTSAPMESPLILSFCRFESGNSDFTIPSQALLEGAVRSLDGSVREKFVAAMEKAVYSCVEAYSATARVDYHRGYPPVNNDDSLVTLFAECVDNLNGSTLQWLPSPYLFGEDFSFFAKEVPSIFFTVGTGNEEAQSFFPLHHPRFSIDETALYNGSLLLSLLALRYCNDSGRITQ